MSEYLIVFVTAENCGHCKNSRGDGVLNNGKALVGTKFLKTLMKHNMEIINLHYQSMMATKTSLKDISKFYLQKGELFQEKYYHLQNKLRLDVYKDNGKGSDKIFNDFVLKDGQKVDWLTFIKERVPNKILNYIFFFPCFMVLKRSNWRETISDSKAELVALTNAGITYKDKFGNIGLKKTQESIYGRNVDIAKLIDEIASGQTLIEPQEKEKEENNNSNKNKNIKREIPMENFIEYKDVIIKSYDD